MDAAPLLGLALDEVNAYEVLLADGFDPVGEGSSARAADADTAGPGQVVS